MEGESLGSSFFIVVVISAHKCVTQILIIQLLNRMLTKDLPHRFQEAANILKEQQALALKRTGLGVMLDSDQPHLVGIDEDVLSTGITLYHLKDGDTTIGSDAKEGEVDIALRGPCIEEEHCRYVCFEKKRTNLNPISHVNHLKSETDGFIKRSDAARRQAAAKKGKPFCDYPCEAKN